jgi:MATE family multidrug resistance protein
MSSRQFTDGLGHTKVFMILTIAALILNVFLNWILIYGNWGAPALGVEGSAYATLISRILMAIVGLWYVRYSKLMKQYVPEKMPTWKSVLPEMKPIWKMGIPLALQTFAEWACFALSGVMVGWYGASQLAAHAVALNIASVTYMIASGFAMAGSILAGNSYGEKNGVKLKKVAHATFLILTIFELFNALIFMLFNKQIAALYMVDDSVMPYILPLLSLAAFFQLSDGIQAGAMGLLRGVKDVVWASIISIISYWVISLPLSYYFGDYRFHYLNGHFTRVHVPNSIWENGQVYGVWIGFTVGLFVASIFGVYRFYSKLNKIKF